MYCNPAGVSLTFTATATNPARMAPRNAARYTAPNLDAGSYEVRAERDGFHETLRRGIQLGVGQTATLEIVLKVGSVKEQVEVTGDVVQVETTSSTDKGIVNREMISELPLNGRDFSQLAEIQVGVYANPNMGKTSPKLPKVEQRYFTKAQHSWAWSFVICPLSLANPPPLAT